MLQKFGIKNFYCFKEWMEISFEFNSKVPESVSNGQSLSSAICLKGANASGKTNAIKALSFIGFFCTDTFNLKPDEELPFESFFGSEDVTELFIDFKIGDISYSYEAKLLKTGIVEEKISHKIERMRVIFERNESKIIKNSLFKDSKKLILRKNASIISSARQTERAEIYSMYQFFESIFTNVGKFGLMNNWKDYHKVSKIYENDRESFSFSMNFIKRFDPSIKEVKIGSYENEEKKIKHFPIFIHGKEENKSLLYHNESLGTQNLYGLLLYYRTVLSEGGVLAFDEFDINLHPDILPHLVSLFENKEINKKNAQLIFSTHNNDIIDYMGKYKTYLLDKEGNEAYCYRLDEIPGNILRNDRHILPVYKAGKIGGVPKMGSMYV